MSNFIKVCIHCGDTCSGDYCRKCSTLEKRIQQDKDNQRHFQEYKLDYKAPCGLCEREILKQKK